MSWHASCQMNDCINVPRKIRITGCILQRKPPDVIRTDCFEKSVVLMPMPDRNDMVPFCTQPTHGLSAQLAGGTDDQYFFHIVDLKNF